MAYSSLCLLRRSTSSYPPPHTPFLAKISPFLFRPLSAAPLPLSDSDRPPPPPSSKPPSLSARLSFVFDQIDAIDRDRDRKDKDEALQRIRQWRQNRHPPTSPHVSASGSSPIAPETTPGDDTGCAVEERREGESMAEVFRKEVELVHPWPEWIELMERLAQQNYFDLRRTDEDRVAANVPIDLSGIEDEVGFDFSRDWTTVRNACMNFGRDRFDILRSLSRKDLQILVGHGCPSMDPKVVFSAKLLRKLVHLDEGDVCSSCNLRNSCSRGYILTPKEDEARTLDVMRVLLTFAFDHINGSVENKPLMKMRSVKTVVRKLLHEIVKLSAVPIDPNLPPPVIKKPPPKVKQPPPPPRKRVGRDDVEMKKGDWLCPKCDFMNFAKNTVCLQCDAKRPKRQLLPGEWECPQCNFLNYRRNMACFHCDHKRPPDEFMENQMQARQSGPRTRFERAARIPDVSNSCNFDFDDNESDGADVAAFEFADPPKMGEDSTLDGLSGIARGFAEDDHDTSREPRTRERGRYLSKPDERKSAIYSHRTGFDDFDDEEDDDVDNYELEVSNNGRASEVSRKNFSELENTSGSEDFDEFDSRTNSKWSAKNYMSGSEDDGLVHHPYWKSSHAADSKQKAGGRGGSRPLRGMSFGSDDDELGSDSDDMDENFRSRQRKSFRENPARTRGRISDSDDELHLDSELDDRSHLNSSKNKRRGNQSASRGLHGEFRRDGKMGNRRNSFANGNDDLPSRDSRRYNRRSHGDSYSGRDENDRFQRFDELNDGADSSLRRRERGAQFNGRSRGQRWNERSKNGNSYGRWGGNDGFRHSNRHGDRNDKQRGRINQYTDRFSSFDDHDEDRPRRRIIER